ncbi:MAG: hypothetical protein AVO35_01810 [Candidatus Aegiribacteria sp. MLS_C]|nr:MAG: hypothetical protein AVO35_01810 [Candidatus Aegiribacteria sp. MLS_C]
MVDPRRLHLYLVTDPVLCGPRGVPETCRVALAAGVGTVQLRDKTASTRDLLRSAEALLEICRRSGALFIVNDRLDVAMASGADGVHLGQDDMPAGRARELLGPGPVLGVSVRTVEEAVRAREDGADYLAANLVFSTDTKTGLGHPLGIDGLRALRESTDLPLVAIGGLKASNAGEVMAAGADGIAVVSAIMASDDVPRAVAELIAALEEPGTTG